MILAFDTSGPHCAAALLSGNIVVSDAHEAMAKGQAERLMVLLEEVLEAGGTRWADLTRIGVGIGPGNFTGIRIAVSAARGLALGLGIPAIGVSTLEAMAHDTTGSVGVILDARQGRTYQQVFLRGYPQTPPALCEVDEVMPLPARAEPMIIGHDAARIAPLVAGNVGTSPHPLAHAIARIAAQRAVTPGTRPSPLYIRAPDAAPARDAGPRITA